MAFNQAAQPAGDQGPSAANRMAMLLESAHDLRGPLVRLRIAGELLRDELETSELSSEGADRVRGYLSELEDQAQFVDSQLQRILGGAGGLNDPARTAA